MKTGFWNTRKKDDCKNKKLRDPLDIRENDLVIAERLKKKVDPGNLYKGTTKNKLFFNKNRVFTINRRVLVDNKDTYYYLLKKIQKLNGEFHRQELFGLRSNQYIIILTS